MNAEIVLTGPADQTLLAPDGKSVIGTIMATLMQRGIYTLDQPAPVPEWQGADDPRKEIRIQDIMRMSSGIRIKAPNDPDYDPNGT